jgi:uncharacterized protein (TIGR00266 family)
MTCPSCGAGLPADAAFCTRCGARRPSASGSPPPLEPAPAPAVPRAGGGLRYQVVGGDAFACARIELARDQAIRAEAGAMVGMSANVELDARVHGGVMGALKRVVTRESIFVSTFTARGGAGEVLLAPPVPGDVVGVELDGRTLLVQSSSWLAGEVDLTVDTEFAGFRGLFAGEGLFFIRVTGHGTVLLSSYGAVVRRALPPGSRYVVDTGHVVAFEAHMPYQVRKAARSGWLRSVLSGEALVAEFTGPGDVWLQTRNLRALAGALFPLLPSQGRGQGGAGLGTLFD